MEEIVMDILLNRSVKKALSRALFLILVANPSKLPASTVSTNGEGLTFSLIVSQTNFLVGEKIAADMVVSNTLDTPYPMSWVSRNPCGTGIGEFLITNCGSNERVPCTASLEDRAQVISGRLEPLEAHTSLSLRGDLES